MKTRIKSFAAALVLTHLVVANIHGWAHQGAMVSLTRLGYAYVALVVTLAPIVAAALLFTRWLKFAASLLTLSMLGSFAFGVWNHFLVSGTDNVTAVTGPWHSAFLWTAFALAVLEFLGVIVGSWIYLTVNKASESVGA